MKNLGARVLIGAMVAGAALLSGGSVAGATENGSSSEMSASRYWEWIGWYGTLAHCQRAGQLEVHMNGALGYACNDSAGGGYDLLVDRP